MIHVDKGDKNKVDEMLIHLMTRFMEYHAHGNTCCLISGDANFSPILHTMKHKWVCERSFNAWPSATV